MVQVIRDGEARDLKLPGRKSLEIVSSAIGSDAITLRLVEIPVVRPGDPLREPHRHAAFEECMFVLAGQGITVSPAGEVPISAGDTILVPPGEPHVTRNTGDAPLKLLCFFPVGDCSEQKP